MLTVLYDIIFAPIELVLEVVFTFMFHILGSRTTNQGLAVIGVSIAVSLFTLPLYRRADAMQQKEHDRQKKLSHWVGHIRKTFKGDKRFMMLQAYYRENGYSPLQALKGSIPLILEIPFFIAAYHFLSNLTVLGGASFGPINDLGAPDGLIHIGKKELNVLPVLMTVVNFISSAIYLKGFPLKDKLKTNLLALVFLILLYDSPSGLVVYWTCNNVFSLIKNIFYKLKNPRRVLDILCAVVGLSVGVVLIANGLLNTQRKIIALYVLVLSSSLPLLASITKKYVRHKAKKVIANTPSTFVLTGTFLVVLTGILIPTSVISSSPAEFIDILNYSSPLRFLGNSVCYALGFFMLWGGIIYIMLETNGRYLFEKLLFAISVFAVINYMCFGRNLGNISPALVFDIEPKYTRREVALNFSVLVLIFLSVFLLYRYKTVRHVLPLLCLTSTTSAIGVSLYNVMVANNQISQMSYIKTMKQEGVKEVEPIIRLSRTGKNVVIFMLDRAINGYIPYIFKEKPLLQSQFAGFTYYPNSLSYGKCTNLCTPALFGGYEYTPAEINKRDSELLGKKQDEALKVLPAIFSKAGYTVTVCDPPYAGYKWIPDLSIFNEYPEVRSYITSGLVKNENLSTEGMNPGMSTNKRNFFCYGVFKCLPLSFSLMFYDKGAYANPNFRVLNELFLKEYSVLTMLPKLTSISIADTNTYTSLVNNTTHEPCELQLPDYEVKVYIDNRGYKTSADGHIGMNDSLQVSHYHVNAAALIALGNWFDFLRENCVYDNTRIILVADHGRDLGQFDYMLMTDPELDVETYNPLLMMKDFYSEELITDNSFMTIADVPTLATEGLIENPTNPFTGNAICSDSKTQWQLVNSSHNWNITKYQTNTTFDTSDGEWFSVHDNIFSQDNWKKLSTN